MAMMIDAALKAGARLVTRNGERFAILHQVQRTENGAKSFTQVFKEIPEFKGQLFESPVLTRTTATSSKLLTPKGCRMSRLNKLTTTRSNNGVHDELVSSSREVPMQYPEKAYTSSQIHSGYTPASQVDYLTLDHTPMFLEKEGEALGNQNKLQTFLKQFLGI